MNEFVVQGEELQRLREKLGADTVMISFHCVHTLLYEVTTSQGSR